ncbi:hypothetical protein QBC37DRAFT_409878 [Rhypophila decipiens]|uniref:ubiquitinyl hydrolase 1 n=1 Tax=Rhypophila decipiens TaxID=261697 RepID=A0AAN7BCY0_9PEZI|nr:hypothetical protein QBC37DRAFT_409878 [Rhypophila decipiens]
MDSDRRRFLSNQNQRELYQYSQQYGHRKTYSAYYSHENLWDRLESPVFILSALCLVLAVLYQLGLQQGRIRPVPGIVWDLLVSIIPARLLYFVDSWVNPPFFPRPQDPGPLPCDHTAKSELLKKILGINTNATPSNAISSWINSFVTMPRKPGPPGLENPFYSCFRNSVLQSLATWKPYVEYLDNSAGSHGIGDNRPRSLHSFLTRLRGNSRNQPLPVHPVIAFRDKFDSLKQHDAHEYYLHLLNKIDEELKLKSKSPRSKNPVEGLTADRTVCTTCRYFGSIRLNPFKALDLALGSEQVPQSLSSCLDRYTALERYTDINCNYCTLVEAQNALKESTDEETKELLSKVTEALKDETLDDEFIGSLVKSNNLTIQKRTKTKQTVILRSPQLLAIHIERSMYSQVSQAQTKNRAKLMVPLELDLGPWVIGSAENEDASGAEEWFMDPNSSMAARSKGRSRLLGPKYRLTAVVFHKGKTPNTGHYLAMRNHEWSPWWPSSTEAEAKPGPPPWFLCSDDVVDPIESMSEEAIANRREDVHMLFYECIDPMPERTRDTTEVPNTESSKTV